MPIINRTNDASEQKEARVMSASPTVTGIDYPILVCERPMLITDARAASIGLSGAPTTTIKLQRFIAGSGNTTISISGALTNVAFSTSGYQQFSLPATGSSLLALQKGDMITATSGGSNAALTSLMVDLVVQNLQDIKTWY